MKRPLTERERFLLSEIKADFENSPISMDTHTEIFVDDIHILLVEPTDSHVLRVLIKLTSWLITEGIPLTAKTVVSGNPLMDQILNERLELYRSLMEGWG